MLGILLLAAMVTCFFSCACELFANRRARRAEGAAWNADPITVLVLAGILAIIPPVGFAWFWYSRWVRSREEGDAGVIWRG